MLCLFDCSTVTAPTNYNDPALYVFGDMQAGVSRYGGSFGVNSALLELDKEADDRCCMSSCCCLFRTENDRLQVTPLLLSLTQVK